MTNSSVRGDAFTPGPWEALKGVQESDEMRCAVVAVRGDYRYLVATIENGAPGDICDTEFANARLIAAAPGLLGALRYARNLIGPDEIIDAALASVDTHPKAGAPNPNPRTANDR